MQVALYTNNSENYRVVKSLTARYTENCTLKDGCSIEDPVILIQNANNICECNYMYIADFNRYYYIADIISVRNGLWELHGHVDVLMSFATEIKACSATCKRQENLFNLYLDDPEFKTYNKADIVTKVFTGGGGFKKEMQYVLVVSGGGASV